MEAETDSPWKEFKPDSGEPASPPPGRKTAGSRGGEADEILSPKQYLNYQHGRILAGLYILFGCMLAVVGVWMAVTPNPNSKEPIPPAVGIVCAIAGLSGMIGGVGAMQGKRGQARLMFVMAAVFVFGCPVGTIITFLMVLGFSRHMDAAERLRGPSKKRAEPVSGKST
jgi:hypothetical protein